MNKETEEALLANVKAITDRLDMVDKIFAAARMGVEMELVFMCGESGLYYPADYVKNWGRVWGDGLGPDVCSESLQSQYDIDPPEVTRGIRDLNQIMHPLRSSRAQMDAHLVDVRALEGHMAVPAHVDWDMSLRAPILRAKQLKNPAGRLARLNGKSVVEAMYAQNNQGGWR